MLNLIISFINVIGHLIMVGMLCYDFFILWLYGEYSDQLKHLASHFLLSIYSSCLEMVSVDVS